MHRPISRIVIHTAAAAHDGKPVDQSAANIRHYHMATKGWADIGYHYVVRFDGRVEEGRPVERPGAHVEGMNRKSVGICFTGHGDLADFTPEQKAAGVELVCELLDAFNLVDEFWANPMRVLGHHECYGIPGVPNTHKTCPGKLVDCSEFRRRVIDALKQRGWTSDTRADDGPDEGDE